MVVFQTQLEAVVQDCRFQSYVGRMRLLPLQVGVGKVGNGRGKLVIETVKAALTDDKLRGLVVQHVTLLTIGGLQGKQIQPVGLYLQDIRQIGIS